MRKKKVDMTSVGHSCIKIQVKLFKIGPLIDNIIIIIIIIMIIMTMMMMITITTIVIILLLLLLLLFIVNKFFIAYIL